MIAEAPKRDSLGGVGSKRPEQHASYPVRRPVINTCGYVVSRARSSATLPAVAARLPTSLRDRNGWIHGVGLRQFTQDEGIGDDVESNWQP